MRAQLDWLLILALWLATGGCASCEIPDLPGPDSVPVPDAVLMAVDELERIGEFGIQTRPFEFGGATIVTTIRLNLDPKACPGQGKQPASFSVPNGCAFYIQRSSGRWTWNPTVKLHGPEGDAGQPAQDVKRKRLCWYARAGQAVALADMNLKGQRYRWMLPYDPGMDRSRTPGGPNPGGIPNLQGATWTTRYYLNDIFHTFWQCNDFKDNQGAVSFDIVVYRYR